MLESERNHATGYRRAVNRLRSDTPRWWAPTALTLVAAYGILTAAILIGSPLNAADQWFYDLHLVPKSSHWHLLVEAWVFLGQRAPAMLIAGSYAVFRWRRLRSGEPLATFATASFLFVATVAAFKYSTGRIGPRFTSDAYTAFAGGDIFPSGHVTGAVVMYGFLAMSVPPVHRRMMTTVAIAMSVTVGMGTVALNTHWASDVLGGWINGALVLMGAWMLTPCVQRRFRAIAQRWRRQTPAATRSMAGQSAAGQSAAGQSAAGQSAAQPHSADGSATLVPGRAVVTAAEPMAAPGGRNAAAHAIEGSRVEGPPIDAHPRGHDRTGTHPVGTHAALTMHGVPHAGRDRMRMHTAESTRHRATAHEAHGAGMATQRRRARGRR